MLTLHGIMEKQKKHSLKSFGKNLTAVVSVALVLLILGIVCSLASATRNVTDTIKENLGFTVVLRDNADAADMNRVDSVLHASKIIATYEYLSADSILRQEETALGTDIVGMLGVNPYQAEFIVKVKPAFATTEQITAEAARIAHLPEVSEVKVVDIIDSVNNSIRTITVALLIVALALILISFVLINNTVRLTIYSSRFLLHTMQLVGATASFIRRPIVVGNLFNGLLSAAIAIIMLLGIRYYAAGVMAESAADESMMADMILPWGDFAGVAAGMIVAGVLICGLASLLATNKYLRRSYDDLF